MAAPSTPSSGSILLKAHLHNDVSLYIFYVSALLAVYCWRFSSLFEALFLGLVAFGCAPNRLAARSFEAVLEWPGKTVTEFEPLPLKTLHAVVSPFRWVFPLKSQGSDMMPKQERKLVFVTNSHIVGVDMPLLIAHIASEFGVNVRTITKSYHFQLPIWKHALEFLGCVPNSSEVIETLLENGSPLLVYHGADGKPAQSERAIVAEALRLGYTIIPMSTVGLTDAFKVLGKLPRDPVLQYLGLIPFEEDSSSPLKYDVVPLGHVIPDSTEEATDLPRAHPEFADSSPQKIFSEPKSLDESPSTLPLIAPYVSPQAIYLTFGKPILPELTASSPADWKAEEFSWDAIEDSIRDGLASCRSVQEKDPERYSTVAGSLLVRRRKKSMAFKRMKSL
ncbi:hypothetical protein HDU97_006868 [Phlyctochytrium planicorne]|nr:hypothetical protein HDU97_006868 [Phlyctochytrium planicorne]